MSAAEIFNSYRNEVVAHQCGTQFISVNRMQISLLMQLMRIYKDPTLVLTKPLNVNFVGEHAADVGGPTKEYFHEAISILRWTLLTIFSCLVGKKAIYFPCMELMPSLQVAGRYKSQTG